MPAKDYSTISPSARALLLLKGVTSIPFAREAAQLAVAPEKYEPDYNNKDVVFWGRVVHFEIRYHSIDQLLGDIPAKNILELSSGFSFRGLARAKDTDVHYIDTDLPAIIDIKQEFTTQLQHLIALKGTLETLPLNALDEGSFREIASHFPPGEITIVNEGLLMYLDVEEKRKLLGIIRSLLKERGGYWITADIYTKMSEADRQRFPRSNDALDKFLTQHNIEENKFDSIDAARDFFKQAGFVIDREATTDYTKISSLPYLRNALTAEQMEKMRGAGKMNETWRLKVAG